MESWVHQQIKGATIVNLQTVTPNQEIRSVPCLMNYDKGILVLHPLKNYDHSNMILDNNVKSSIHIEDLSMKLPYIILLKGKLKSFRSHETWMSLKQIWTVKYPHLIKYFELQDRYIQPGLAKELLSFIPSHISSWENQDVECIKFDLEIVQ